MITAFPLRDSVAVITGAASGIGAALADLLAQRGCHLALADRDQSGLAAVATCVRAHGVLVSEHILDVANAAAIAALPAVVLAQHTRVNIVINNAGIATMGNFVDQSAEDFEMLININLWGVIRMTRAFLPLLQREPIAQLVNISSVFGLIAPAGQVAYATSKFGVRGFSEALTHELEKTSVGVSAVHPGGIHTAIARNAQRAANIDDAKAARDVRYFDKMARTTADQAAAVIVAGIEQRKKRILIGRDAKILDLIQRLLPVGYWALLMRLARMAARKSQ
jgi:short-subunit dehydrogenase